MDFVVVEMNVFEHVSIAIQFNSAIWTGLGGQIKIFFLNFVKYLIEMTNTYSILVQILSKKN